MSIHHFESYRVTSALACVLALLIAVKLIHLDRGLLLKRKVGWSLMIFDDVWSIAAVSESTVSLCNENRVT